MKKIALIFICAVMLFTVTGCSSTPKEAATNDARDLDYFKKAFIDAGYILEKESVPAYVLINAYDGILFNVGLDVVKIYQFKNEETYNQAVQNFAFIEKCPKNGLFIAESSSKDLLEFFSTIK